MCPGRNCNSTVNIMASRKKKGKKKRKTKRRKTGRTNPMFHKPLEVDSALQDVIGAKKASRGMIVKKVWDYIKKHNLQDEKNRRMINPDAKLKKVVGNKKQVNMLKLPGLLNKHIKKDGGSSKK